MLGTVNNCSNPWVPASSKLQSIRSYQAVYDMVEVYAE